MVAALGEPLVSMIFFQPQPFCDSSLPEFLAQPLPLCPSPLPLLVLAATLQCPGPQPRAFGAQVRAVLTWGSSRARAAPAQLALSSTLPTKVPHAGVSLSKVKRESQEA